MRYELMAKFDSRKSFYGKAIVVTSPTPFGEYNSLYSYGTLVAETVNGNARVYGFYSPTTLRHIKEFLKQNGFKAESKSQIAKDYLTLYI